MVSFTPPDNTFSVSEPKKWRPRLKSGYFYIQDREYYLYAKKLAHQLKDLTFTKFELEFDPKDITSLKVDGMSYSNFYVSSNGVIVNHRDLEAYVTLWLTLTWDEDFWDYVKGSEFDSDTEVEVEYTYCLWNPGTESFSTETNIELFNIKDGNIGYRFERPPVSGAPVVITDDRIKDGNGIDYCPNFSVDYLTGELKFHGQGNLVENSDFTLWTEDFGDQHPDDWIEASGVAGRSETAWYGCYSIIPPSGSYVFQQPEVVNKSPYSFSAEISGSGCIGFNFVDASGDYLDASGIVVAPGGDPSVQAEFCVDTSGVWQRETVTFGENPCFDTLHVMPSGVSSLEIRLSGTANFDAISLLEGYEERDYVNHHANITVEYEMDPSGLYTYDPAGIYDLAPYPLPSGIERIQNDFPLTDVNLNPVSLERHHGFLYIEDDLELLDNGDLLTNSKTDFGLGLGGFEIVDDDTINYSKGRKHFPYAKTRGRGKLLQTQYEYEVNQPLSTEITEFETHGNFLDDIKSMVIDPPIGSFESSGTLSVPTLSGEDITISVIIKDGLGNGILSRPIDIAASAGMVDSSVVFSEMSGRAVVTYTPPAGTGTHIVTFTTGTFSKDISIIVQDPADVSPEL